MTSMAALAPDQWAAVTLGVLALTLTAWGIWRVIAWTR